MARAPAKSPASARSHKRAMSPGISFETTEITPSPPKAISGRVIESSPESTEKPSGTDWQIRPICPMSPDASLTATMLGMSASRASRSGLTLQHVRPGTL